MGVLKRLGFLDRLDSEGTHSVWMILFSPDSLYSQELDLLFDPKLDPVVRRFQKYSII